MPNNIGSFDDAIQQTAVHEVGHAMYSLLGGIPDVQIDIQVKKIGEAGPWEVRGTHYHRGFEEETDQAAQGLAGVIAQVLLLNPDIEDPELYERTINHPSLSESDRVYFDPLTPEQKKAAFAESAKVIRRVLPLIAQPVGTVFSQFKERTADGATSVGFRFSWQGPRLALEVVPIKQDLFESDRESK